MKRNIFLSVFLPLFLCAAILTLGYFSPTLFSRVMPNFKNKESAAQITGAESPLYLEDPSSLVLPPWNEIDDSKSQVYASDDNSVPGTLQDRIIQELYIYAERYDDDSLYEIADNLTLSQCYIEVSDAYVRSIIQPFLKGCRILPNMKFSGLMHTYDPNSEYPEIPKYVYARNVTVKTVEGRDFIVDFVFTPQYGLPLYVHATEVDASTRAMPDNDAFTAAASTALTLFQRFSSYSTSEFDEDAFIRLKKNLALTIYILPYLTAFSTHPVVCLPSLSVKKTSTKRNGLQICGLGYISRTFGFGTNLYTIRNPFPESHITMNPF